MHTSYGTLLWLFLLCLFHSCAAPFVRNGSLASPLLLLLHFFFLSPLSLLQNNELITVFDLKVLVLCVCVCAGALSFAHTHKGSRLAVDCLAFSTLLQACLSFFLGVMGIRHQSGVVNTTKRSK